MPPFLLERFQAVGGLVDTESVQRCQRDAQVDLEDRAISVGPGRDVKDLHDLARLARARDAFHLALPAAGPREYRRRCFR